MTGVGHCVFGGKGEQNAEERITSGIKAQISGLTVKQS